MASFPGAQGKFCLACKLSMIKDTETFSSGLLVFDVIHVCKDVT